MQNGRTTCGPACFRAGFICALALLACAVSACGQKSNAQNSNAQNSNTQNSNVQSNTGQNEPIVNWADGKLVIDGKEFKLSHAYATIEYDPFDEGEYKIRVLLSEQPVAQDILDDHTAFMNMKKDAKNHAIEIDIDKQRKVTWIGLWGLGQLSGLEYPFEPVVVNEKMVEGRLFTAKAEKLFEKQYQYDAKFKSTVRVDPIKSFVTASTGKPLAADGGEPGRAYLDYQTAIRTAKGSEALDKFYSKEALKQLNADPKLKDLVMEMQKGSQLEEIKIVNGLIDGDKATLSVEGKREGERNVRGKVNMHLEEGRWKVGAQAFKSGD
jgi:hypothetical protein